jgi:hypothetical protein
VRGKQFFYSLSSTSMLRPAGRYVKLRMVRVQMDILGRVLLWSKLDRAETGFTTTWIGVVRARQFGAVRCGLNPQNQKRAETHGLNPHKPFGATPVSVGPLGLLVLSANFSMAAGLPPTPSSTTAVLNHYRPTAAVACSRPAPPALGFSVPYFLLQYRIFSTAAAAAPALHPARTAVFHRDSFVGKVDDKAVVPMRCAAVQLDPGCLKSTARTAAGGDDNKVGAIDFLRVASIARMGREKVTRR